MACICGHRANYVELRAKPVLTAMGQALVSRPYYLCRHRHTGQLPADVELDIENTELSPGVRRMLALVGQQVPFDYGHEQMKVLAGLEVTTKAVERSRGYRQRHRSAPPTGHPKRRPTTSPRGGRRADPYPVCADGTGVPVVKQETEGRKGKAEGQPAHMREAKLGSVQANHFGQGGLPSATADSTTYTGAIESAEEFRRRLDLEAWNRGWSRALEKVVISDGAEWIRNLVDLHFPAAIQIVDLYHTRQHLWEVARIQYPNDGVSQKAWMKILQKSLLDKGKIEKLVIVLRSILCANPDMAEKIRIKAEYFESYAQFGRQGLFVGSGVIEAAAKRLSGIGSSSQACSGRVRGANAILALRCCQLNGRFEEYWDGRLAA